MSFWIVQPLKDYFVLENEKYYTTSSCIGYCIQFDYISIFLFTMIVIKKTKKHSNYHSKCYYCVAIAWYNFIPFLSSIHYHLIDRCTYVILIYCSIMKRNIKKLFCWKWILMYCYFNKNWVLSTLKIFSNV